MTGAGSVPGCLISINFLQTKEDFNIQKTSVVIRSFFTCCADNKIFLKSKLGDELSLSTLN